MDYQGNSDKSKEKTDAPKKEIVPLSLGSEVVVSKPSVSSKFKHIFFGGDFSTAAEYVASQVLLPALRNLLLDTISKGADRLIYGDTRPPPRPGGMSSYQPRVQYNNPIHRPPPTPSAPWTQSSTQRQFRDVTVGSKEDAEMIVEALMAIVDQYDVVSVSDLNELIGEPSSHIDNKWGWENLSRININQTRTGWTIVFPPLEEI